MGYHAKDAHCVPISQANFASVLPPLCWPECNPSVQFALHRRLCSSHTSHKESAHTTGGGFSTSSHSACMSIHSATRPHFTRRLTAWHLPHNSCSAETKCVVLVNVQYAWSPYCPAQLHILSHMTVHCSDLMCPQLQELTVSMIK